jgi:hypothetical protein
MRFGGPDLRVAQIAPVLLTEALESAENSLKASLEIWVPEFSSDILLSRFKTESGVPALCFEAGKI